MVHNAVNEILHENPDKNISAKVDKNYIHDNDNLEEV